ncbi:electron transfer flavoprotein subunit alpha/FixB family protein [Geodermatophilus sp. SYSU D00703]
MSGVLVLAQVVDGHLEDPTAELVTAAAALGGPVTLGIATADPAAVLDQSSLDGVDAVITVRTPSPGFSAEVAAAAASAMVGRLSPDVVLLSHSIRSASFAAALAERAGAGFAADVVELRRETDGTLVAVKPVYGGKVLAEVAFPTGAPAVVLCRTNVWQAATHSSAAPAATELDPVDVTPRVRHVEYHAPESTVDLKRADVILSIGRGVGTQENVETFARLADRLGALLGASRPLIDAGWVPAGHQVGQTGVTVKPKVYLAFGISGAVQHLAGMQASKLIVAVNSDASAPIFRIAHIGAVADVHEVAEQMEALLAGNGGSA